MLSHWRKLKLDHFFAVAALIFTTLLVADYWQIVLWQPDSAYYDLAFLKARIKYEGRWLMPFISPSLLFIDGRIWITLSLIFLFGFFFICAQNYTKKPVYSLVFAALCIQAPSISYQLMWPAITVVPLAVLFCIAMFEKRLPIWLLYCSAGIVFFGTASNLYYLLPLLHLGLLKENNLGLNLRKLCLAIIPAWAFGFVVGYLVMQLAVYVIFGTTGLEIRAWREPHPINDIGGLIHNIARAFSFLLAHLEFIFSSIWACLIMLTALIANYFQRFRQHFLIIAIVCICMILVHYVITIPVGIKISFRTIIATWIGLFALAFLNPNLNYARKTMLTVLMLSAIGLSYAENKSNLSWYASVSNTLYKDLNGALPMSADTYKGVIFLSDNREVYHVNLRILEQNKLTLGKIPWLNTDSRWATAAYKAGFKEVILCGSKDRYNQICLDYPNNQNQLIGYHQAAKTSTFNHIHGVYQGYLVVSFKKK